MRMATLQPEVLERELAAAGVTHGGHVRADMRNVRVIGIATRNPMLAFCNIRPLGVRRVVAEGDGGELPRETVVDVPDRLFKRDGLHNLFNMGISTNGQSAVRADAESRAEFVGV